MSLITKWVGQAWEEISEDKEMIIRSFNKCGISVPIILMDLRIARYTSKDLKIMLSMKMMVSTLTEIHSQTVKKSLEAMTESAT